MNGFKKLMIAAVLLLTASMFSSCDVYTYTGSGVQTNYANPQWAPPYYQGARYYYLPDIETYYDLSSSQFVYLDNGQWISSRYLPSMYGNFDLNNSYTVVLNDNVYQPWMHNQYYVSHYPRYYYRNYYDHSNIPYVRGFNENSKSAIYYSEKERYKARSWDNQGSKTNRQFRYTKPDRQQQSNTNSRPEVKDNYDRQSQTNNRSTQPQTDNNNRSTQPQTDNNNRPTQTQTNNNNRSTQTQTNNNVTPQSGTTNPTGRQTDANKSSGRTTQNTNYYGRSIGQSVKVEKQMRQPDTSVKENNRQPDNNNNIQPDINNNRRPDNNDNQPRR